MRLSEGCSGKVALLAFAWALVVCADAQGVEFAGGTGEPNDPYQIATAEQLASLNSDPELPRKHYVLVASIDMSGIALSGAVAWFLDGSFDGDGYTIRNLRIESESTAALFGHVSDGAEVRNLGVVNAQIVGGSYSAALVRDNSGSVVNCYSTGAVINTIGPGAGGLVGLNWGTVTNCYSTAAVLGNMDIGGLVGTNAGIISSCYATGEVTGSSDVGGLVGNNGGEIAASYAVATVAGQLFAVGGLAGNNYGRIITSYSRSTVVGQNMGVGGLVGWSSGNISSCYAAGAVTGLTFVGGLVGQNSAKITACYSVAAVTGQGRYVGALAGGGAADLVTSSYFLAAADGSGLDNGIGIPLTSAQMKQQASFAGFDFWGTAEDGNSDLWYMPESRYPVLAWQAGVSGLEPVPNVSGMSLEEAVATLEAAGYVVGDVSYDYHRTIPAGYVIHAEPHFVAAPGATIDLVLSSGVTYDWTEDAGDGTAASPYEIQTAGQLESLADYPELWDKYFVVSADLDMVGRTYSKALIAPDVDTSKSGFQGTPFSGTFDGQDHTISNLTIFMENLCEYLGLFGVIAAEGQVSNLKLVEVRVESRHAHMTTYVGALAGHNAGTVIRCSATGILDGWPRGDGLVGTNTGSLIDCHADVATK